MKHIYREKKKINKLGQVTLEFIFSFLIVLLIFYSCIKALQWFGQAILGPHAEHRKIYQQDSAVKQMQKPSDFHRPIELRYTDTLFKKTY